MGRDRTEAPWLSLLVATPSEAYDAALAAQGRPDGPSAARVLRGSKMTTAADLFDEAAAALQFPPYFGENWDALDECLADLDWLPAGTLAVTILDGVRVLDEEDSGTRQAFWEMLERAAQERGRRARAFSVAVQCAPGDEARMRERLPALGSRPAAAAR